METVLFVKLDATVAPRLNQDTFASCLLLRLIRDRFDRKKWVKKTNELIKNVVLVSGDYMKHPIVCPGMLTEDVTINIDEKISSDEFET